MNTEEIWREAEELQQDLAYADTREQRLHYAAELNENYQRIPDDAPLPKETL